MNKSHLVKQWKKTYGEDFERQYGGVFRKLPFHFSKKTLVRLWDKTYGEKFEHEYPQVFKLLGVKENKMKLTKSKLKEIIKEVINEETSDKEAASEVIDYLKSAYKLSKKYPPGKFDHASGTRGHPADLALTGAERYWDGRIAKVLGIDRDIWNFDVEQRNATKLIAKIIKKAEKNFKKIK